MTQLEPEMEPELPEDLIPEMLLEPEIQILDMTEVLPALGQGYDESASADDDDSDRKEPRSATNRAPNAAEWQDFIGGTVLRLLTEGYLYLFLYRYIDENDLSPREREAVRLTKQELRDMAAPMASVAAKSKIGKKHGRTIIASAESYESIIDMFFWMRRVNKISAKYRKARTTHTTPDNAMPGEVIDDGIPGENATTGPVSGTGVPNVAGIFNRGSG